jgi:hypothetical protein
MADPSAASGSGNTAATATIDDAEVPCLLLWLYEWQSVM